MNKRLRILFLVLSMYACVAHAQGLHKLNNVKLDSVKISNYKFINNLFKQAVKSVKTEPDTTVADITVNGKSELPYLHYEGKIIRHIHVEALNFERNFSDTSMRIKTLASKIADAAHTNTRAYVVRNSLFIKENTPLDPYKVADNERYLRTLDYINDARILVQPLRNNPDSVDLLVLTKDFFSLSADASSDAFNHIHTRVVDANIAGTGQRAEVSGLYDYNRTPNFGYGVLYRNNNIAHSFINATLNYSQIFIDPMSREEERTYAIDLERPLVSPYSHFAGGVSYSHNEADNLYHTPDTTYYKYQYENYDAWIGYNIGVENASYENIRTKNRTFVAIRYLNYNFNDIPFQIGNNFDPLYNTRLGVLAELTLFKQKYFKTQYIYGFGTTEDFPYGYNFGFTAGWFRQLDLERLYTGFHAVRYIATNRGGFLQLYLRTGGFYHEGKMQDASILVGSQVFSRMLFWKNTRIREFLNFNYTRLYNKVTYAPLRINNQYGVRGFLSDSAYGDRRISLQTETEFFLNFKLLGFKFAPFTYADVSLLTPNNTGILRSDLYSSLGGGIRARNENLIFGTIELRFYYYPRTVNNMHGFKVVLSSNVRYRYSSNYVTKPDIVQLNGN